MTFFLFLFFFGWHAAAKQQKQCGIICMLMHMCWEYSIRGSTSPTQPGKRQCQRCPLAPLRLINLAFPHSLLIKSNYLYSRGLAPLSFFLFFFLNVTCYLARRIYVIYRPANMVSISIAALLYSRGPRTPLTATPKGSWESWPLKANVFETHTFYTT